MGGGVSKDPLHKKKLRRQQTAKAGRFIEALEERAVAAAAAATTQAHANPQLMATPRAYSLEPLPLLFPRQRTRIIRIYVCTTPTDFAAERRLLSGIIFPRLRQALEPYGVQIVDVDLRSIDWNTPTLDYGRLLLRTCLDEIDHCRPYFIAMLGARYGFQNRLLPQAGSFVGSSPVSLPSVGSFHSNHPVLSRLPTNNGGQPAGGGNVKADLLMEPMFNYASKFYPWLQDYRDRSVTECEIRHAVLNRLDRCQRGRTFFYFRDERYLPKDVSEDWRTLFESEGERAKLRLMALKEKIREACKKSGVPIVQYMTPEEGCEHLLKNLTNAIIADTKEYEEAVGDDNIAEETNAHDQFAWALSRRLYVASELHAQFLASAVCTPGPPVIVTGPALGGKASLLAAFYIHITETCPSLFVMPHFSRCILNSALLSTFLRRLLLHLARHFGLHHLLPLPSSREALFESVSKFFSEAVSAYIDPATPTTNATASTGTQQGSQTQKRGKDESEEVAGAPLRRGDDDQVEGEGASGEPAEEGAGVDASGGNGAVGVGLDGSEQGGSDSVVAVVVLDGLEEFEDFDLETDLDAVLEAFSSQPHIRIIMTANAGGQLLRAAEQRGWPALQMGPMDVPQRRQFVEGWERNRVGGPLFSDRARITLSTADACANPGFLRWLLEDLRASGLTGQSLDRLVSAYCEVDTPSALYVRILQRWDQHFDVRAAPGPTGVGAGTGAGAGAPSTLNQRRTSVHNTKSTSAYGNSSVLVEALRLLHTSRFGLTEPELLSLLGAKSAGWCQVYSVIREHLCERDGVLTINLNVPLRQVVNARYMMGKRLYIPAARALVAYFDRLPQERFSRIRGVLDRRRAHELPSLLRRSRNLTALRKVLSDIGTFLRLCEDEGGKLDLADFWRDCGDLLPDGAAQAYMEAVQVLQADRSVDRDTILHIIELLFDFFKDREAYEAAEIFGGQLLAARESLLTYPKEDLARMLHDMAEMSLHCQHSSQGLAYAAHAIAIREQMVRDEEEGANPKQLFETYELMAALHRQNGDLTSVLTTYERWLATADALAARIIFCTSAEETEAETSPGPETPPGPFEQSPRQDTTLELSGALSIINALRAARRRAQENSRAATPMTARPFLARLSAEDQMRGEGQGLFSKLMPVLAISATVRPQVESREEEIRDEEKEKEEEQRMDVREVAVMVHDLLERPLQLLVSYHLKQNHTERAIPYLRRLIEVAEKAFGDRDPPIGLLHRRLGDVYAQFAKQEAEMATEEAEIETNGLSSARSLTGQEQGQDSVLIKAARHSYERALTIAEEALAQTPDDVEVKLELAECLSRIGGMEFGRMQYEAAVEPFQRCIGLREEVYGGGGDGRGWARSGGEEQGQAPPPPSAHRSVIDATGNLALTYYEMCEYGLAQDLLMKEVHLLEQIVGAESPELGDRLHLLATTLWWQALSNPKQEELRLVTMKQLLRIRAVQWGNDNPDVMFLRRYVADSDAALASPRDRVSLPLPAPALRALKGNSMAWMMQSMRFKPTSSNGSNGLPRLMRRAGNDEEGEHEYRSDHDNEEEALM
mmetsp:Transcript_36593/g.59163  ORF Transcript_36593/g.59163 Transcript_36593/m.59163 type:complete len:1563 (-) Transcript_36593:957-5645(-)|eukprot:CAMPEP_0184665262 /NCGR_PEP_ID=MMETSP0308-20130426/56425_1 /TAXON_ID=38269 /ORGANISM="Gloeochaete witrockiana, Strain SAG 46.84" /LENGTH=1562 /DNA_ID=CAMNT_0027109147 /DNA_START=71 /DNA_END=4759 /DNA_ORIENTATION=+